MFSVNYTDHEAFAIETEPQMVETVQLYSLVKSINENVINMAHINMVQRRPPLPSHYPGSSSLTPYPHYPGYPGQTIHTCAVTSDNS